MRSALAVVSISSNFLLPYGSEVCTCTSNCSSLIITICANLVQVLEHAREEYLFIYSVYVLEASTSNRLTYFLPPLVSLP